jgi:UDP-glucose 4-epimerase
MEVLVTGGAGYIGSIVTEELLKDGYNVIVLDNLQQGHQEAISNGVSFTRGDINDPLFLEKVFQQYQIEAVMHMAAETEVETSMVDPHRHFKDNVAGGINLLEVMLRHDVRKFIFSSSAAVYGEPRTALIDEGHAKIPVNVYGETKLIFERILERYRQAYGIKYVCLRYFNAAGASLLHGEDHAPETHLIPRVIRAALNGGQPVNVFGADYPTRDGSCVRDYVHVVDIARAHILALNKLEILGGKAFNLGSGEGYTVTEVVNTVKKVSGKALNVKVCSRRAGDPAVLVASSRAAQENLGWFPQYNNLESIVESSWQWMKEHPNGYKP